MLLGALVLAPTLPPPAASPSPRRFHGLAVFSSLCGEKDVEELRLNETGVESVEESGVLDASAVRTATAAAAGLQWAQMNMLKPRPSQVLQMEPLLTLMSGDV